MGRIVEQQPPPRRRFQGSNWESNSFRDDPVGNLIGTGVATAIRALRRSGAWISPVCASPCFAQQVLEHSSLALWIVLIANHWRIPHAISRHQFMGSGD